jgi:C1A family cysteine protease
MSNNILPRYGWKKDPHDHRDKLLKFGAPNYDGLPAKVDLREYCSTVENQATLGSCTANAAVGALEYLEIKNGLVNEQFENFSRLYVYYNMREDQGTLNEDSGGTLRGTIKVLNKFGTCDEKLWGYDINKFTERPAPECYEEAEQHKIAEYRRLTNLPDMLRCLADGYPFVFGFMVFPEFGGPEIAKTGILHLPNPNEECQGGHAVCAVGYDMDAKTVLVRNSWGEAWGQDGYFIMPFDYINNQHLAQDYWTIRK